LNSLNLIKLSLCTTFNYTLRAVSNYGNFILDIK
jgi:hypothetical protein